MKRIALLIAMFFIAILATPVDAANPNANWRALAKEAYTKADLVMHGNVESVDDQTAVDGGHVYQLQITSQLKGAPVKHVSVRAGGYFYNVPLDVGESVLVFLKSNRGAANYSMVEVAPIRPMVFRKSGANAKAVDKRLQSEFADVTNEQLDDLLSTIEP